MLQQHGSYMFVNYLSPTDESNILLHRSPSLVIYGLYANNTNTNNKNNKNKNNKNNRKNVCEVVKLIFTLLTGLHS